MKYEALSLIRSTVIAGGRRAYHVKGKKLADDQAKAGLSDARKQFSAKTMRTAAREALEDWARRSCAGKFGQLAHSDLKQIDWLVDLEVQRPFRSSGELIAIGDMTLDDVTELAQQMDANIAHAREERERFEAAKLIIVPIMEAHPGWTWGMAVESLAKK